MEAEVRFMQRALELARLGQGRVSPNPMVGCVIVHQDKIIGEGWHRQYGGPHAEVHAIRSVKQPELLKESTAYVSLEPCSHWGKTPPCASLLIEHKVKEVVVCNTDSNPLVAGGGLHLLHEAGINVRWGLLEEEGRWLNRRFFTFMEQKRPYLVLKWAQTADGFMARPDFDSKWISSPFSRKLVHQWRAQEDAIMVGRQTVQYDNPQLNVRDWPVKEQDPVRILIDRQLQLTKEFHVFDRQIPTLCYNLQKTEEMDKLSYIQLDKALFWSEMLQDLHRRGLQSVLIEGGPALLELLLTEGLWDEARIFTASKTFGDGLQAPRAKGKLKESHHPGEDRLDIFVNS